MQRAIRATHAEGLCEAFARVDDVRMMSRLAWALQVEPSELPLPAPLQLDTLSI